MSDQIPTARLNGSVPTATAAEAAATVADDAVLLTSGFGRAGYPKAIPLALAESGRDLSLTVISGGSVGDEIDTALVEAGAIARRFPYQATALARERVNDGRIAFHDRHISNYADQVAMGYLGDPDVAVVEAVAAGEDWLIPSTSVGLTEAWVATAPKLLVELNETQPLDLARLHDIYPRTAPPARGNVPLTSPGKRIGSPRIRFDPDKLVSVVRTDRPDKPYTFRSPGETDRAIAQNLATFLTDEVERNPIFSEALTIQFGVGSLGNALMGAFTDMDFGERTVAYFGEVIQDGLLDMLDSGTLAAASATSLALSSDGQNRLFADIERYAENVVIRNADLSNNPTLIDRFGVVAVNAALEVDLYGHANSTHLNGTHAVNGIGGSGDFSRNSALGILALGSTAAGGDISRIVPMVPHVDHTEHDFSVVVTEHGVADLRGLAPRERATRLIESCADPAFRDDLTDYLSRASAHGGHMPHHLESALDWHVEWRG